MNIKMIGIDHSVASLAYRELFSFTKKSCGEAMQEFVKNDNVAGCIIISTCNRMEIWVSFEDGCTGEIYEKLCEIKGVDSSLYHQYFIEREGIEAVKHLFSVTSGMKSKIMGEDQIITQVKDALALSRENYCTDNVLEVLFRMAVTAAKKVKTDVHLSTANYSAVNEAIRITKEDGFNFAGKTCMVIGNGEMGKLTAMAMRDEGADVTVTVRQYRSGIVAIPEGCKRINYGERLSFLPECDIIASATSSPNVTLKYEDLSERNTGKLKYMIDLAVPRDIDPKISEIEHIKLYNIDNFDVDLKTDKMKQQIAQVELILQAEMEEFISWYECRDIIPVVKHISESAGTDVILRLGKTLRHMPVSDDEKKEVEKNIEAAAGKVVNKILFGIRDNVSIETFRECTEAVKLLYQEVGN